MSVAAGLFADGAAMTTRVFLGQQPQLKVDAMLTRQLQAVYPWFASRRRINEQGNMFIELDATGCDSETMMRYSHVFYVRRQIYQDLLDKQFAFLENGKPPKEAPAALIHALDEINRSATVQKAIDYERQRMTWAKERASIPFRRELDPAAALEAWDVPCMMRCVAEDETSADAERRAKAFLPVEAADEAIEAAARYYHGPRAQPFDAKKFGKLLNKNTPCDYEKVGVVPKLRPMDFTARARFIGEKMAPGEDGPFAAMLWGHLLRRHALHPGFLHHASTVRAPRGAATNARIAGDMKLPLPLCEAVTVQQRLFAGHRFRSQYLYTSADLPKQMWRLDPCYLPLPRLLPTLGAAVSEDLLASVLIDGWWGTTFSALDSSSSVFDETIADQARSFISNCARQRDSNFDELLSLAVSYAPVAIPAPTAAQLKFVPTPLETAATTAAVADTDAAAATDDAEEDTEEGDAAEEPLAAASS